MARAMWSGTISFGLVNVPVKLYSVLRDQDIHFHMLSKDGRCRLRRKLVCPDTGEEYDFKDTARGVEVAPDQYVIVNDKELEALKPEAGRAIEIIHFIDLEEIDPVYYNRPYYLAPDENGAKAYQLLLQAMRKSKKVAVARFVMRGKEYLAAIRPMKNVLCLETMNFADEVGSPDELPLPEDVKVEPKQLEAASKLIGALETDFDPKNYKPEHRQRVADLVEKKAAGDQVVIQSPEPEEAPRTLSLMKALEASVAEAKKTAAARKVRRRKSA